MPRFIPKILVIALSVIALLIVVTYMPSTQAAELPKPTHDMPLATAPGSSTIVLAGGCFWGLQAVFEHVKGVTKVVAGYAGGAANTAQYETVSEGNTGHAESVQVTYDPSQVTLGTLLQVYFGVAHDPTELNRQGPDSGTQYRSAIFTTSDEQQSVASDYVSQLDAAHAFARPIVTKIGALPGFYPAESYHQDYARLHPNNPYIAINDLPKVAHLKEQYPALCTNN